MRKILSVGVLCISLMAFSTTNAAAGYWITFLGTKYYVGSLVVQSDWWVKNLDVRPSTYAVTVIPDNAIIHFSNPGNNFGGDASPNFGTDAEVQLSGIINPALTGKGKIQDQIVFGDCNEDCETSNLPSDGMLWLMFTDAIDTNNTSCFDNDVYPISPADPQAGYFDRIKCVKSWVTRMYAPNNQWIPVSIKLIKFDVVLRAWQDIDNDNKEEEVVYAQYLDLTSTDGVSYTTQNSCVWQYSYPKSLTDECSNLANQCCDPDWGVYYELF